MNHAQHVTEGLRHSAVSLWPRYPSSCASRCRSPSKTRSHSIPSNPAPEKNNASFETGGCSDLCCYAVVNCDLVYGGNYAWQYLHRPHSTSITSWPSLLLNTLPAPCQQPLLLRGYRDVPLPSRCESGSRSNPSHLTHQKSSQPNDPRQNPYVSPYTTPNPYEPHHTPPPPPQPNYAGYEPQPYMSQISHTPDPYVSHSPPPRQNVYSPIHDPFTEQAPRPTSSYWHQRELAAHS